MAKERRVVVTGMGIVSSIGYGKDAVVKSLRESISGIKFKQDYADIGMKSQVAGSIDLDTNALIDRKLSRYMGPAAAYAYLALKEAIEQSGLLPDQISNDRTGIIAGSGTGSPTNQIVTTDAMRAKGMRRVSPFMVPRIMGSTVSAVLAVCFAIRGVNYSITSACSTSAHCITAAADYIRDGRQDVVFAGGGEEEGWELSMMFDAMRAISTQYNDNPATASRPYDANRDGFVIAGGGGMVVLEELEHAKARGAHIIAELTGQGLTSDGVDMTNPSGEGAVRSMQQALATARGPVSYVNTHGTSTPAGDIVELEAIRETFDGKIPPLSATKALTGHSLGATGAQEAIYSLLMLENDFIAASANIETLDPKAEGYPIARETVENAGLSSALSNSFGFGGTNCSLLFERLDS